tara:strand:+ start:3321 stop:3752 length:432 start_codon:yes stop_codon:yes gene_type:complete
MPSVKAKWVKPARDVPFAEGILVYNGTGSAIPADSLVMPAGAQGASLKVSLADASAAGTTKPALFVSKHGIPASSYGVVLPWKMVTFNTVGRAIGDSVFLSDTSGEFGFVAGTVSRVIGLVASVGATGKVWLAPTLMLGVTAI